MQSERHVRRTPYDPSSVARQAERGQQPSKFTESREQLAAMSLDEAMERSHLLINRVLIEQQEQGVEIKARIVLYSGGNDSTVLTHFLRDRATHAAHINTGIGIEETREFVRSTCATYDLELIEESPPPGATYDELVLKYGFPGPAGHMLMYTRLKERGLRKVRARFVTNPRKERVLFMAGMRHDESARRMRNTEETHREGSVVWVSPLGHWTNEHMAEYRRRYPDVPRNEVSDMLHMSGECLCGAFAKPGELEWIAQCYPKTAQRIRDLEVKAKEAGVHCVWGTRPPRKGKATPNAESGEEVDKNVGPLCSACVNTDEDDQAEVDKMIADMAAMTVPKTRVVRRRTA